MKKNLAMNISALTILAVLAVPVQLAAQRPRFTLIDLGTLGGPNSFLSGPDAQTVNNRGIFVGYGNISTPNPNPNCFIPFNEPDCFVENPFVWRNGAVVPLAVLPGGTNGQTDWISANGLISGWSENGITDPMTSLPEGRAVLWMKDGKVIDLGTVTGGTESLATANNSLGQVVGFSNNDISDPFSLNGFSTQTRAFLWQNNAIQDLGTLGGPDAFASVVNDRGEVAGQAYTNSTPNPTTGIPTLDPFLWQDGIMQDLGTLGGVLGNVNWLNNRGEVVGTSDLAGDAYSHGFLWDGTSLIDLHTLGGNNSQALWISDSGLVVGRADLAPPSTAHHAFLWKNGVMNDLGVLASAWPCSTAYSVNSKGQVVGDTGVCGIGGGPSFFAEKGEPMVDINTLVLPGSDLEVIDAYDINDRGEIAGGAVLPNGDVHAIVLVPASAEEIAAANALNPSPRTSATPHTLVRSSENSLSGGRNRALKVLRQTIELNRNQIPGLEAVPGN
jgi:probable HAF family extracellular repeat protein